MIRLLAVVVSVALAACASALRVPDLNGLYSRIAQKSDALRNPILVIPGVLGSRLVDDASGKTVWGAFAGSFSNPRRPDDARLIALPMREGATLAELRDEVRPDGVLDRLRVSLLGLPLELRAYVNILGTLGVGGYRDRELGEAGVIDYGDEHFTCFQFAYDWRRDNSENAARLHDAIVATRAYVEHEHRSRYGIEEPNVKFDIVAHSMGGLLTRYFLRYGDQPLPEDGTVPDVTWAGAEYVDNVILVGTPNAGSVEALATLVEGVNLALFLPDYPPALVGTMPALYQLLPRPRHHAIVDAADGAPLGDHYEAGLWEEMGWGLASPAEDRVLADLLPDVAGAADRRRIALEHLSKSLARARQFAEALDRPAAPPPGLSLHLYAGDAEPTGATMAVDRANGGIEVASKAPGDGRVLRTSAVMDERVGGSWSPNLVTPIGWERVTFLFTDHLGMTRDPAFIDNVLFTLLEKPKRGPSGTAGL